MLRSSSFLSSASFPAPPDFCSALGSRSCSALGRSRSCSALGRSSRSCSALGRSRSCSALGGGDEDRAEDEDHLAENCEDHLAEDEDHLANHKHLAEDHDVQGDVVVPRVLRINSDLHVEGQIDVDDHHAPVEMKGTMFSEVGGKTKRKSTTGETLSDAAGKTRARRSSPTHEVLSMLLDEAVRRHPLLDGPVGGGTTSKKHGRANLRDLLQAEQVRGGCESARLIAGGAGGKPVHLIGVSRIYPLETSPVRMLLKIHFLHSFSTVPRVRTRGTPPIS